ncbi:MAG TPA: hypothetical protein IAC24_02350 [Candidatus Onthousia faecigallinarum]|nr:hypothetical protein [Candidatus Onthousia faecigallinarum]
MRKKRIKRIVFLIIGIIVLFVIIAIVYFQFNPNLEPPIESLQKVDSTLTMEQLKEINRNYREALSEKGVLGQVELYLSDDDTYENKVYKGRFVSEELYTYEFTIDTSTRKVRLIEIAKAQLAREALIKEGEWDIPEE